MKLVYNFILLIQYDLITNSFTYFREDPSTLPKPHAPIESLMSFGTENGVIYIVTLKLLLNFSIYPAANFKQISFVFATSYKTN